MHRRNKYTIEEVKEYIKNNKNGICLTDVYINNKSNLKLKCGDCNHIFFNSFKNIKYLGNWCPSCSNNLKHTITFIKNFALQKGGICLSNTYINNKSKLKWKCSKCNNIWNARFDRVKSGTWCPKCNRSHGEKTIEDILCKKKIEYLTEYIFTNLKNRRFDFYLPQYNMVIEFDGVQHFEIYGKYTPDQNILEKKQEYDIEKTLFCEKNKIKLLRICYKDINYIEFWIYKSIYFKYNLIFSNWTSYDYIINKINNNTVFLTGVGK